MAGEKFDAVSGAGGQPPPTTPAKKAFLGIRFACCRSYARVYRRVDGTAYEGACPRCGKRVRVPIGPGGTGQRFFNAGP